MTSGHEAESTAWYAQDVVDVAAKLADDPLTGLHDDDHEAPES